MIYLHNTNKRLAGARNKLTVKQIQKSCVRSGKDDRAQARGHEFYISHTLSLPHIACFVFKISRSNDDDDAMHA